MNMILEQRIRHFVENPIVTFINTINGLFAGPQIIYWILADVLKKEVPLPEFILEFSQSWHVKVMVIIFVVYLLVKCFISIRAAKCRLVMHAQLFYELERATGEIREKLNGNAWEGNIALAIQNVCNYGVELMD